MHLTKIQSIFYPALIFFFILNSAFQIVTTVSNLAIILFLFCFGSITDCTQQLQAFMQSTASLSSVWL